MKTTFAAIALTGATMMAACAAHDDDSRDRGRRPVPTEVRSDDFRYFIVTRDDLRKCAYPMCGGVYVAELNQASTTCFAADGAPATAAEEADCYVAEIDLSILALAPKTMDEIAGLAEDGKVILRGHLVPHSPQHPHLGKLAVEAAWRGQTLGEPKGHFSHVADAGIMCITTPCFSLHETVLNTQESHTLSGLDLASSGASQAQIDAAYAQLATGGVMIAGTHATTQGLGGEGLELVASEFYMPVKNEAGEACGKNVCGPGTYCCNASCGMCVPHGNACIQIACEEEPTCSHGACETGDALEASCSPCATTVCAADPYCCDTAWDAVCVQEAEAMCGSTCAAPEPAACAHSECGAGAALDATCSPCAAAVCGADPFCCDSAWDALCVDQAEQMCGSVCAGGPAACAHGECSEGAKLEATCSPCAAAVCQADSYCCNVAWDALCTQAAGTLCGC